MKCRLTVSVSAVLESQGCFSKGYNFANEMEKSKQSYLFCKTAGCSAELSQPDSLPRKEEGSLSPSKSNF